MCYVFSECLEVPAIQSINQSLLPVVPAVKSFLKFSHNQSFATTLARELKE